MGKTYKDSRDKGRFVGNRQFRAMKQYKKIATYPTIRCGSTRKVGWKSFEDAQAKANEIMSGDSTAFLRVYECEFCHHFHFSSKENVDFL